MAKIIKFRKPRISVGRRGMRISRPSVRIGGRAGLNISGRGIRGSLQTDRRGRKKGCGLVVFALLVAIAGFMLGQEISFAKPEFQFLDFQIFLPIVVKPLEPTPPPTAVPTETPTPEPPDIRIDILNVYANGAGTDEPDEYVEFKNIGSDPIQLENWTLRDIQNHIFTFPTFTMIPGQVCRVYTNQIHPEYCGFSYGSGSAIWNNTGDCAYIRDAGYNLKGQYCYP